MARKCRRCDRALSQKAHLMALQHQTSQATCRVGAGVDVNSIGAEIGFAGRRVPVNYHLAEILLVQEEIISNPEQIPLKLCLQRNARPNAGVGEKKIPTGERKRRPCKKRRWLSGMACSSAIAI